MNERRSVKAPNSFWIVAGLSMAWNAFGAVDYVMTRMRNTEYLKNAGDPEVLLHWIDGFPLWAQVAWPVGVWGSVIGSVLLLLRSRHAVTAYLVSLAGAVISFAHQFTAEPPVELNTPANQAMPLIILAIIVFLWWFSRRAALRGILR